MPAITAAKNGLSSVNVELKAFPRTFTCLTFLIHPLILKLKQKSIMESNYIDDGD